MQALPRSVGFVVLLGGVALWHGWLLHTQPWWRGAPAVRAMPTVALIVRQVEGTVPAQAPAAAPASPAPIARPVARTPPVQRLATAVPEAPPPAEAPAIHPLPLYPTRLAPPVEWTYRLQRGEQQGVATLAWRPDFAAARYEARLAGEIDGRGVLHWSSRGALDEAGIAPERFVLREPRRGALATNFERALRRITYSGPPVAHALPDGAQDRLSWLIQLAGVVAADPPRHGAPGAVVELFVAGARGDADRWRFDALGAQAVELADGTAIETWAYARAPLRAYDVRVEAWLAPAWGYLPVRLRVLPTGAGRPLELLLTAAP